MSLSAGPLSVLWNEDDLGAFSERCGLCKLHLVVAEKELSVHVRSAACITSDATFRAFECLPCAIVYVAFTRRRRSASGPGVPDRTRRPAAPR